MAGKKSELGPIGEASSDNVKRLREEMRLSYAEMSRTLEEIGRPIPPLGLRRIEEGERRIDVDDLVALAIVLQVSPLAILLPNSDTAVVSGGPRYPRGRVWQWAQGTTPLGTSDPASRMRFAKYSNPVEYEVAERRQEAGEINQNPVAVGWVAEKRVRERRTQAITEAVGDSGDGQ